jgi:hypothetical protein
MGSSPRMIPLLAMAGVIAALSMATPALAADYGPRCKLVTTVVSVKTASASSRRHYHWSRYRVASWYASHLRYADAAPAERPASWSGRPVLLMVGIAF